MKRVVFMRVYKHVILVIILLSPFLVVGQNTCSQTLLKAQIAYYEGRAEEVSSILEACLKDGFTDEERSQAYRLLTLTHLYLNETQQAENSMLSFLRLNHYYKINEAVDPTEFINLYQSFRTRPIYLVTPKLGTNISYIQVIKNFSPDNTTEANYRYEPAFGYQVGASVEIPLTRKFSANTEIYLSGKKYLYKNELFGYESLSFIEQQSRIELPLLLMYIPVTNKRLSPFFQGGFSLDAVLNTTAQVYRIDRTNDAEARKNISGPDINLKSQRKLMNYSAVVGSGVKYTRGKNTFILDIRYNIGFQNIVKSTNRYSNPELIYKYGYMDNDFRINSLMFSMGYEIPVFNPKKMTRKSVNEQ